MIYVTQLFATDLGLPPHNPQKPAVSESSDPKAAAPSALLRTAPPPVKQGTAH
jgi:hypothetical protein